jgi:hypothetical protein
LSPPEVKELRWRDPPLGEVAMPRGKLRLTLSVGSGLTRRLGDPAGVVWGLGDRGPNIKVTTAIKRYGLDHLAPLKDLDGAKVLPLPAFQPMIAELQVGPDRVTLIRTLSLHAATGPLSGRALPGGPEALMEPTFDLQGRPLGPDPHGVDPEGVAALGDGGFWISEEYGPSLLKVDTAGLVRQRWTPVGLDLPSARAVLPAAALDRRLNRGFEGLAISADERLLYVVFQSARRGEAQDTTAIWTLDADSGALLAEHAYPFDAPDSFTADAAEGEVKADDLKVCELVCIGANRLLVLERVTRSARIYAVDLSASGRLTKTLVFSTDHHPQITPDLEGVVALSDRELLIATDNDFGTEGAETRFYRLTFAEPY